ncbi:STAS domain-containing protein [Streptomyces sp. bgisy126]|uniref:STAS domain-containing protein n=1 Tax=unclassified Streptomyces TaxID=2593676 RepID=UPI003EBDFF24
MAHHVVDGVRVATLRGEIDYEEKDALREVLLPEDATVPLRIVVDMSGVTFLDSNGINVFIMAHQQISEAQGRLRIAAPTKPVRRILSLIGVDTVINCYSTLEQAPTA